jgi:hypothetical protein
MSSLTQSELRSASEHGKWIVPVLRRDVDADLPDEVRSTTWVFFREQDDAETAIATLLGALERDPEWKKDSGWILTRALEWDRFGRDKSLLLRGPALLAAEAWLARSADGTERFPTQLQAAFVVASRKGNRAFTRERRRTGVFISYRRDETRGYAGRLHDGLSRELGQRKVFIDVDSIAPGANFVHALEGALDRTFVLIVLIGEEWLRLSDADGQRRLDDPKDFVRVELEAALGRGMTVIPLLVDGASMPTERELPASLVELTRHQALTITHEEWKTDFRRVLDALPSQVRRRRIVGVLRR